MDRTRTRLGGPSPVIKAWERGGGTRPVRLCVAEGLRGATERAFGRAWDEDKDGECGRVRRENEMTGEGGRDRLAERIGSKERATVHEERRD